MAEDRLVYAVKMLSNEIQERKIAFNFIYREYEGSDQNDKEIILDELIDTLDALKIRMRVYEMYVEKMEQEITKPSFRDAFIRALYESHIQQYKDDKMMVATFESLIMGMVN